MKHLFRLKTLWAACAVVMLTVSCGSSSDDSTPPPTIPLPPSVSQMAQEDAAASASVAGFIAFMQTLLASLTLDTNEPRGIDGITPMVTDTAEPTAI
jgi:hypothetical protein